MLSAGAIIFAVILATPKILPMLFHIFPSSADLSESTIPEADVAIIKPVVLEDKISATGTIRANQQVDLRAEVSGKITGLNIEEGAAVEKEKLLVKINDNDLQAQVQSVEYNLEVMKEREDRQRQLFERGGSTQEDYDATLMELNELRSELDYIEAQIAKTEIRAPFDGILGLKYVNNGTYISPTTRIATLQDITSVLVDFSVPERYSAQIQPGNRVLFTVQAIDSVFTGEVFAVEPRIETQTRTLQVRALSDNENGLLRPGAFASIELILDSTEDALMVPSIALIPDMGQYTILLYQNGIVIEQAVETGTRTNSRVHIREGLSAQDTVLVNGLLQLRDSMEVSIRNIQYGN